MRPIRTSDWTIVPRMFFLRTIPPWNSASPGVMNMTRAADTSNQAVSPVFIVVSSVRDGCRPTYEDSNGRATVKAFGILAVPPTPPERSGQLCPVCDINDCHRTLRAEVRHRHQRAAAGINFV